MAARGLLLARALQGFASRYSGCCCFFSALGNQASFLNERALTVSMRMRVISCCLLVKLASFEYLNPKRPTWIAVVKALPLDLDPVSFQAVGEKDALLRMFLTGFAVLAVLRGFQSQFRCCLLV